VTNKEVDIAKNLINDILSNSPEIQDHNAIAELLSEGRNESVRTFDSNTAIISHCLINKIKPSHINVSVKSVSDSNLRQNRKIAHWLYLSPTNGLNKAEPLAISWSSGNHITLLPNPEFLCVNKLIPRSTSEITFWDDVSLPKYDIVCNKPVSFYEFPNYSHAYVKIDIEYLKDFLHKRGKAAVKIFQDIRDVEITDEILELLAGKEYFILELQQYEIRITKYPHEKKLARIELNGYFQLFKGIEYKDEEFQIGHYWKGIDGQITKYEAIHKGLLQFVYVSDDVLSKYEEDDDYLVNPEHGSVKYGIHWSISHCERIGRNTIRIELKKLYEGVPLEVIDYWNEFSVNLNTINKNEEHVVTKAKRLIRKYFLFGRLLSNLINEICDLETTPVQLVGLDEQEIEYHGLMQHQDVKPIANHISADSFYKNQLISRCKYIYILLGENLNEKMLRKAIEELGFSKKETNGYRSLKLLDLFIKYLFVANQCGLNPKEDKHSILDRLDDYKEIKPIAELFAINDIRQIDAHKNSKDQLKLDQALEVLQVERNSFSNNYSNVCHIVYDSLIEMFTNVNNLFMHSLDTFD